MSEFTQEDYKKLVRKLPDGTIVEAAVRAGVDRSTIYNRLQKGDPDTIALVIAIAREFNDEKSRQQLKAKALIDSL